MASGSSGELILFGKKILTETHDHGQLILFGKTILIETDGKPQQSCNNITKKEKVAEKAVAEDSASSSASWRRSKKKNLGAWTEQEHNSFLSGVERYGKGNWKKIADDFVKTRTTVQVATHAQKCFETPKRSHASSCPSTSNAVPMGEQSCPLNNNAFKPRPVTTFSEMFSSWPYYYAVNPYAPYAHSSVCRCCLCYYVKSRNYMD